MAERLRLALPNKGMMEAGALRCLAKAGFPGERANARQYTGRLLTLPDVELHFQRNADMYGNLEVGQLDAAITGYDNFVEAHSADDQVLVVQGGLGFGACELVLAVPERWLDIVSIGDLAEMATRRKAQNRPLRIATKYMNTARTWLHQRGITQCLLIEGSGAIEAAPGLGYADCIVDLTASGLTLRENRLKQIQGGRLLRSEACLIASRAQLRRSPFKLETLAILIEGITAERWAKGLCTLQAALPDPRDWQRDYPNVSVMAAESGGKHHYLVNLTVPTREKWGVIQKLRSQGALYIHEQRLDAVYASGESAKDRLQRLLAIDT